MGIKFLDKILDILGEKYVINMLSKEHLDFFGNPNLRGFNCHIDFSILLYKYFMTFSSMEEVLNFVENFLYNLSKKNNVFLYIDPYINLRKQTLQKYRYGNKLKTIKKSKDKIKSKIQNIIKEHEESGPDGSCILNKNVINLLEMDNDSANINKEDYNKELKFYIQNDVLVEGNDSKKQLKHDIFSLFINSYNFKFHHEYVLNFIKNNKKLNKLKIINSEFLDAEINMVHNILKTNTNMNILFSCDQDVILFTLYHFKTKLTYIKKDFNTLSETLYLYKNNILNKNISYIVFFFNISDYFPGIAQFNVTHEKIDKLMNIYPHIIKLFNDSYDSELSLIATFLQFFKKNVIKYVTEGVTDEYIDLYFNEIKIFLNLNPEFFNKVNNLIYVIHIHDIFYYLKRKRPTYKVYENNCIINKCWENN